MTDALRVGIVGAVGYTGSELLRLVHAHPRLKLSFAAARENAGKKLGEVLPSTLGAPDLAETLLESFDPEDAARVARRIDVAFTALPHAASARVVAALVNEGVQVVDLSADFRLHDQGIYESTYGPHPHPELLGRAVYGLVELHREELAGAQLIASPGCYPTSALLALAPLVNTELVVTDGIIIDSKSGVSGVGRKVGPSSHFPECGEGLRPYKVAGEHRHTVEIEQELGRLAGAPLNVVFTPHLCPMTRGILSVAYARLKPGVSEADCIRSAKSLYATPLVSVLDGLLPDTLWVRGSACAHVAYRVDARTRTVLSFSAIDNLTRGASAQAMQSLNVARRWEETLGLSCVAQFP